MHIGIFGAGKVGSSLARAWAAAGHHVMLSARNLARAQCAADGLERACERSGGALWTGTPVEAASFADVLLLAVPSAQIGPLVRGASVRGLGQRVGHLLGGKLLIDATNAQAGWSIPRPAGLTASECLAAVVPDATVVKAFNMMPAVRMAQRAAERAAAAEAGVVGPQADRPLAVFMAADAVPPKQIVAQLVRDAGFAPVDLGRLPAGAAFEPGAPFFAAELDEAAAASRLARLGDATAVLPREYAGMAA